jgi:c-di-GMP-binding flagellar brake protein YcgR
VTGGAERRQHHRFLVRLDVRVVAGDNLPADLKLVTVDVGVGGARCVSSDRLTASSRLQIILTIVGGPLHQPVAIPVDAVVLRCDKLAQPHHGFQFEAVLQFARIDPREKRQLQSYLNAL